RPQAPAAPFDPPAILAARNPINYNIPRQRRVAGGEIHLAGDSRNPGRVFPHPPTAHPEFFQDLVQPLRPVYPDKESVLPCCISLERMKMSTPLQIETAEYQCVISPSAIP